MIPLFVCLLGIVGWVIAAAQTIRHAELKARLEWLEDEHVDMSHRATSAEATIRSWVSYNTRKDFG